MGFMVNQVKQGRAETENYQDKGNDDDAFDNHGSVMLDDEILSILVY